jgi:hypothetical protein
MRSCQACATLDASFSKGKSGKALRDCQQRKHRGPAQVPELTHSPDIKVKQQG